MENDNNKDNKKVKKKEITSINSQNAGTQPQRKGWMDLLKNYIKNGKKPTKYQQEEETTKLFLEIIDEDQKKKANGNKNIPRFFYKKPTNFTDINITVKNEAKQKFLILKSYDLPTKKY